MDFRDLISSNSPSISTMNITGNIGFISNASNMSNNDLLSVLSPYMQIINNSLMFTLPARSPYMSEIEEKAMISYEENKLLLEYHYKDITKNTDEVIYEKYLKVINTLWMDHELGDLPNMADIMEHLFENRCECCYAYSNVIIIGLLKHFFMSNIADSCDNVRIGVEFYLLNNRFPNMEEIESTAERMQNFMHSPEQFHINDKVEVGVKDLDKLKVSVMDKNEFKSSDSVCCSICQDEINSNQSYVRLEPCGHLFHFSSEECLDGASVIDWLKRNKFCPNCKCEVKIEN